jgi:methionine aminopeptidase
MTIESEKDLVGLRRAGRLVALAIGEMKEALEPGVTTAELDAVGAGVYERYGARSAPRLVYGFPGVNLISVNDEAVHGVPGDRVIESEREVTSSRSTLPPRSEVTSRTPPSRSPYPEGHGCTKN